jgi:uncharacterized membrane protein (DUF485 family)
VSRDPLAEGLAKFLASAGPRRKGDLRHAGLARVARTRSTAGAGVVLGGTPMSTSLLPEHDRASSYIEVQQSQEFTDLRARFRRFVFPMTGLFLSWYFLYVLLAAYAPVFMSHKLVGNINIGLVLGLGQFASTFAITMIYARWADRQFDPTADRLRAKIEGETR